MTNVTVTVTPDDGIGHSAVEVKGDEYEARIIVDADARDEDDNILTEDYCLYHMANRIAQLEAERDQLRKHVEVLQEKNAAETCACSYDNAGDVCQGHSPVVERLREERDALAAHVERLKEAGNNMDGASGADRAVAGVRWCRLLESGPQTSLAQRDARMKAEALDCLILSTSLSSEDSEIFDTMRHHRDEYRHQSQEAPHESP